MKRMTRYDWLDALIRAQTAGHISNGGLLVATKLSMAINWSPKGGKPAGLYWKNDDAFKACGLGRATYYKHREELFGAGFFCEERQNLIPCIPESLVETAAPSSQSTVETMDSEEESTVETIESQSETGEENQESLVETEKSTVETGKSLVETEKSLGDNPLSVDTLSEDTFSVEERAAADAPAHDASSHLETEASQPTTSSSQTERSDGSKSGEFRKSLVETEPVLTQQERARQKALALRERRAALTPVGGRVPKAYVKEEFASW